MDLPVAGGFGVVAIVIAYRLLTERSEIADLRKEIGDLRADFTKLEAKYDYQRHRSHLYREVITKMVGSVDLAAMLTEEALTVMRQVGSPEVDALARLLGPISDILERLHAEVDAVLAETQREPDS